LSPEYLIVWDCEQSPPKYGHVWHWNGYNVDEKQYYLLDILEENSSKFKHQFFQSVNELLALLFNQTHPLSKKISSWSIFWWMNRLVEKNPLKSPMVLDGLRLLAFAEEIGSIEASTIQYVGDKPSIAKALKQLCSQQGLTFLWEKTEEQNKKTWLRRIWSIFPPQIQAFVFLLRYIGRHWKLREGGTSQWFDSDTVFFFSYFDNLNDDCFDKKSFHSRYWGLLPDQLRAHGKQLNWMNLFMPGNDVTDAATGNRLLKIFNQNPHEHGHHAFLESFLSFDVLFKVFRDWFLIQICFLRLNRKIEKSVSKHQQCWLWPVLRKDWRDSIIGVTAMQNLLWIHLFDKALNFIPRQAIGLYLCENLDWERVFIHFWQKHGHGKLVGFAHSTIRDMDLNYFDSPHYWEKTGLAGPPRPDTIAISGPAAWNVLIEDGHNMDYYSQVEALRYMYLSELSLSNRNNFKNNSETKRHILVLGDTLPDTTHRMLKLIEDAFSDLSNHYDFWIKPHPNNPIELARYPRLVIQFKDNPLDRLLPMADLTLASVFTSATLDSFCSGVPTINYLDPYDLNFSNLRGFDNVEFISSASELIEACNKIDSGEKHSGGKPDDFFWLDSDLSRWKKSLGSESFKTLKKK